MTICLSIYNSSNVYILKYILQIYYVAFKILSQDNFHLLLHNMDICIKNSYILNMDIYIIGKHI